MVYLISKIFDMVTTSEILFLDVEKFRESIYFQLLWIKLAIFLYTPGTCNWSCVFSNNIDYFH